MAVAPERPVWPSRMVTLVEAPLSEVAVPVLDHFVRDARLERNVTESARLAASSARVRNHRAVQSGVPAASFPWEGWWVGYSDVPDWTFLDWGRPCRATLNALAGERGSTSFECTRFAGHTGRHAAGTGARIVAVWGDRR